MTMLRYGAVGEAVRRLQLALNLEPGAAQLHPDGKFGLKTHGRVTGFQESKGLVADGIVGPMTMGLLQPLFDLLDKLGKSGPPAKPGGGNELGARIAATAVGMANAWGWTNPARRPDKGAPNIALRWMEDEATRDRHGGRSLLTIFHGAGASALHQSRCPKLGPNMAATESDEAFYKKNRNSADVPSWCGIFALYVLRRSGVFLQNWAASDGDAVQALTAQVVDPKKPATAHYPLERVSQAEVRKGDIGVCSPQSSRNHHFIVTGRDGPTLATVDGNAGIYHSIIQTQYTLQNSTSSNRVEDRMIAGTNGSEPCALLRVRQAADVAGFVPF